MSRCLARPRLDTLPIVLVHSAGGRSRAYCQQGQGCLRPGRCHPGGVPPVPSLRWSSRIPGPRPAPFGSGVIPASRHRARYRQFPYPNRAWRAQMAQVGNTAPRLSDFLRSLCSGELGLVGLHQGCSCTGEYGYAGGRPANSRERHASRWLARRTFPPSTSGAALGRGTRAEWSRAARSRIVTRCASLTG
jgi:hypothetical protein